MTYKLGSLFDGSGGFPLAGSLCWIEPAWASEVEPYPIAVTRSRFPNMKHLGDISKINGAEVEPVDIITFGSPCQDLSVAGKRAGLKHEANGDEETTRSGLFMEAVRIIREMKEATHGRYPSYALWENVPGAFSSNGGEDFRIVLEELIKIVEPSAVMPAVPKNGWPYADSYCGDGWSLAYRVFDAQYWGVPQRRRRIHLVLDLRGERAREVLFEREGVRGYFAEGRTPWQAAASHAEDGTGTDDREGAVGFLRQLSGVEAQHELSPTILAAAGESGNNKPCVAYGISSYASNAMLSDNPHSGIYEASTSRTLDLNGGNPACNQGGIAIVEPICMATQQGGAEIRTDDKAPTVTAAAGMSGNNQPVVAYSIENHPADSRVSIDESGKVQTLTSRMGTGGGNVPMVMEPVPFCKIDRPAVVYALDRASFNQGQNAKYEPEITDSGINSTLVARGPSAVAYEDRAYACTTGSFMQVAEEVSPTLMARDWKDPTCVATRYIVRRLTPTECARLQGFADRWGDIEPKTEFSDAEYRFWMEVRNTHATVIGGKEAKEYTKEQMLTWYNKLQTDSSEYKMWGNGIALPPALYCLQGITDALNAYAGQTPDPNADVEMAAEETETPVEEPNVESVCEEEPIHEEEPVPAPTVDPEKEKMRETLMSMAQMFGNMAQQILEVCK